MLGWYPNGTDLTSSNVEMGTNQAVYMLSTSTDGLASKWSIIAESDYPLFAAKYSVYQLSIEADAVGASSTEAESLYASGTTVEDMEKAYALLKTAIDEKKVAIIAAALAGASTSNPVDLGTAGVLVNGDFSQGSLSPWVNTNGVLVYSSDSFPNTSCTAGDYNSSIDCEGFTGAVAGWVASSTSLGDENVYQELGILPAGLYTFSVEMVGQHGTDLPTGITVYVQADDQTKSTEFTHDATQWATAVANSTNNQQFEKPTVTIVHTGGAVTVGVKLESTNCNWVYFSNAVMTYYGESEESAALYDLKTAITTAQTYEDTDTYYYSTATAEELSSTITAAQKVADQVVADSEYEAQTAALNALVAQVKSEITAYSNLADFISELKSTLATYETYADYLDDLYELADEAKEAYEEKSATVAEIEALIASYDDLLAAFIDAALEDASLEAPIDVTDLFLQNADLSGGSLSPWENTNGVLVYSTGTFPNSSCNVATLNAERVATATPLPSQAGLPLPPLWATSSYTRP